jgi:nucleotide-binding universal stress UspA family protein
MSKKTIVLSVDVTHQLSARNVAAAVEMTRDLARDTGDRVVVLHVHEFAVGRFGRLQVDCGEGDGERLVAEIVAGLKEDSVNAEGVVREANVGHVARRILAVADDYDARMLIVGSSSRTDVPHLPYGSVSHRLLHLARRPVLIVPRRVASATAAEPADAAAAASRG